MKAKKLFPDVSFNRLWKAVHPVDNLDSTDKDKSLSANMGRELGERDYIVEQGKIENTYYRKWNSGVMEQWLNVITTEVSLSQYSTTSWYIGSYLWTYPIAFSNIPVVTIGMAQWGTSASFGTVQSSGIDKCGIRIFDAFARTSGTNTQIQAYAYGYWK